MEIYKIIVNEKLKEQNFHNKLVEYDIVMRDITRLTPKQLTLHLKLVDELLKKWYVV